MSSQAGSFVSRALAGEVMGDAIDDCVDQWHQDPAGKPLHDYLGMMRDEYALWMSGIQSMRLAGRADDTLKLRCLAAWLRDRTLV